MFSLLLIFLVALGFSLSLFLIILLFISSKKFQNCIEDPSVIIVKFIELHRENLPVDSAHGWTLVSSPCSLRCWQKDIPFPIVRTPIPVFACTKEIPCAAVILLNVIADVSTWSEWDIEAQDQTLHLELPEDSNLHGDSYMQCDQVFTSKFNTKPEVQIYRFGNLESNGTGWILLWNAKQFEWTLYIAQPIESVSDSENAKTEQEHCLLTALWGRTHHSLPDQLAFKIHHLSEAIRWSQTTLRPFRSMLQPTSKSHPHFPTIRSALSDLPTIPCVLLQQSSPHFQNEALALVAKSPMQPMTLDGVVGWSLVLRSLKGGADAVGENGTRRGRRRQKVRSDSMNTGLARMKNCGIIVCRIRYGAAQNHLENDARRSSSLSTPLRKKTPPELTVTQADDDDGRHLATPQRASSHSFLHSLFQRRHSSDVSYQRSRSPSPCKSKSQKRFFKFKKTSSLSSQEDLSRRSSFQDGDVSDVTDVDSNFLKMAQDEHVDFKSLGEYSISAVLQENLKASQVDIHSSEDEQKRMSGGWVFKEITKNNAVYKKTTTFDSFVFMSYLCKGVVSSSVDAVWRTLCNPMTRFMYDETVKKISVLLEYPSGQKLIHMCNQSVSLLKKEVQDFCILQTEKIEGSQHILGFNSVKDVTCPPTKDIVRGTVVASGWVVEPVENSPATSQVSYLIQMIVSSPEASSSMEEISAMQSQCIHNLSVYLSAKPPTYLPVH